MQKRELEQLLEKYPMVTLPEPDEVSRYVQISVVGFPILRCGEGTTAESTGKILNKVLAELGIEPDKRWSVLGTPWYADAKGKLYEVVGSGNCLLKDDEILFSMDQDGFQDYPLGVDWRHLHSLMNEREFMFKKIKLVGSIDDTGFVRYELR